MLIKLQSAREGTTTRKRETEREVKREQEREKDFDGTAVKGRERGLERKTERGKDGVQLFPPHTRAAYARRYVPTSVRIKKTMRCEDPSVGIGY